MKFKNIILIVSLFLSQLIQAQNQNVSLYFGNTTLEDAVKRATKEKKLIFIDAYTTWCGPCKWMSNQVFTNGEVGNFYNEHFINVKLDMEKKEGISFAKKYNIESYPTFIFLNDKLEIVHKGCGAMDTKEFLEMGKMAFFLPTQLLTQQKRYLNQERDSIFLFEYICTLEKTCSKLDSVVDDYFKTIPEKQYTSKRSWRLIYNYINDESKKPFEYLYKNYQAFQSLYPKDSIDDKIVFTFCKKAYQIIETSPINLEKLNEIRKKITDSKISQSEKALLLIDWAYFENTAQWSQYIETSTKACDKYMGENHESLNNTAWRYYERFSEKSVLEKAITWSEKSLSILNYSSYRDTYAHLLYKLGRNKEAIVQESKAIRLAKDEGGETQEYEAVLQKMKKGISLDN